MAPQQTDTTSTFHTDSCSAWNSLIAELRHELKQVASLVHFLANRIECLEKGMSSFDERLYLLESSRVDTLPPPPCNFDPIYMSDSWDNEVPPQTSHNSFFMSLSSSSTMASQFNVLPDSKSWSSLLPRPPLSHPSQSAFTPSRQPSDEQLSNIAAKLDLLSPQSPSNASSSGG